MSKLISVHARPEGNSPAQAPGADPRGGIDWGKVFAFPNPVNEYSARITAALVVLFSLVTLLTGFGWGLAVIAAGFWLRVLFGPRISPFGVLSVKVLTPWLGKKRLVPGPPKRFAQGLAAGLAPAAWILLALLIVAASLEAFAGFCLGCAIFGMLQRRGLIPEDVCEACNNISLRRP